MDKAKLMIFNTFYNHLLFDPQSEDEKSIRLLIFGTDKYAAAALKQAFSCGQLQNRNLHIAIVSPQNKNIQTIREKILEEMPGLADLARIGCDWCSDYDYSDIYADIAFVQGDFSNSGIKNTVRYFSPNYIICSVGNDEENVKAASAAASASKNIFTGYICKKKSNASENKKTVPIFPISRIDDINPELRRMAYNTHFIYAKSTSERTLAKYIYEQFNNNEYNGESSYAFALHIKYKLASLWNCQEMCSRRKPKI